MKDGDEWRTRYNTEIKNILQDPDVGCDNAWTPTE